MARKPKYKDEAERKQARKARDALRYASMSSQERSEKKLARRRRNQQRSEEQKDKIRAHDRLRRRNQQRTQEQKDKIRAHDRLRCWHNLSREQKTERNRRGAQNWRRKKAEERRRRAMGTDELPVAGTDEFQVAGGGDDYPADAGGGEFPAEGANQEPANSNETDEFASADADAIRPAADDEGPANSTALATANADDEFAAAGDDERPANFIATANADDELAAAGDDERTANFIALATANDQPKVMQSSNTLARIETPQGYWQGKAISSVYISGRVPGTILMYLILGTDGSYRHLTVRQLFESAVCYSNEASPSVVGPDPRKAKATNLALVEGPDPGEANTPKLVCDFPTRIPDPSKCKFSNVTIGGWFCRSLACRYFSSEQTLDEMKCPKCKSWLAFVERTANVLSNQELVRLGLCLVEENAAAGGDAARASLREEPKPDEEIPEKDRKPHPNSPRAVITELFDEHEECVFLDGTASDPLLTDQVKFGTVQEERTSTKRRRKRVATQPGFNLPACGTSHQPVKTGWVCYRCNLYNSYKDPSAPGLCKLCSFAQRKGRLRTCQLRSRILVNQTRGQALQHGALLSDLTEDNGRGGDNSGPVNSSHENAVARYKRKTEHGRQVTLYELHRQTFRDVLSRYMKEDVQPSNADEANTWWLTCLMPRDWKVSMVAHINRLNFGDLDSIAENLSAVYNVARSETQICLFRGFDRAIHLGHGPVSKGKLSDWFSSVGLRVYNLANNTNHLHGNSNSFAPQVINEKATKDSQGRSMLEESRRIMEKGLDQVIGYLAKHYKTNMRGSLLFLHLGFTAESAGGWKRCPTTGETEPPVVGEDLPESVRDWFQRIGIYLADEAFEFLMKNTDLPCKGLKGDEERRKWARLLASNYMKCGTEEEKWNWLFEHMSFLLGDHRTMPHTDGPNDVKEHADFLMSCTITVDVTGYTSQEFQDHLRNLGLDPTCLRVTVLFYMRKICGYKTEMESDSGLTCPVAKKLVQILAETKAGGKFADHVDVAALDKEDKLKQLRSMQKPQTPTGDDYPGYQLVLYEGVTRYFWASSFADASWRLLFQYTNLRKYRHLIELWAFMANECNGQIIFYTILSKWLCGCFCDSGQEDSFLAAYAEHGDLYLMASLEACHLKGGIAWISSSYPRYQSRSHLLVYDARYGMTAKGKRGIVGYKLKPNAAKVSRDFVQKVEELLFAASTAVKSIDESSTANAQSKERSTIYTKFDAGLQGISGVGHMTSMAFVQLCGPLGLLPADCMHYASVDGNHGGSGTTLFIVKAIREALAGVAGEEDNADFGVPSRNEIPQVFWGAVEQVNKHSQYNVPPGELEQVCCRTNRDEEKQLKRDILFADIQKQQIQCIFAPRQLQDGDIKHRRFEVGFYDFGGGGWKDWFATTGIEPSYRRNMTDNAKARLETSVLKFGRDSRMPTQPRFSELRSMVTEVPADDQ